MLKRYESLCKTCGGITEGFLEAGVHPPCPDCKGETEYLWRGQPHGIETDEAFIGGLTIENLGHDPVTVYSRAELESARIARGIPEQRIKWVPGDKYLINWAAGIDAQTLANAKVLVERAGQRARAAELLPSFHGEIRTVETENGVEKVVHTAVVRKGSR